MPKLIAFLSLFSSLILSSTAQDSLKSAIIINENSNIDVNEYCLKIDSIVDFALSKVGSSYKYGSAGPNTFDCSGLMYYSFQKYGITLQRSSTSQYKMGKPIEKGQLQKGDLVFFTRGQNLGHVGLVTEVDSVGNFKFVHASNQSNGILVSDSKNSGYTARYVGARRIINCEDSVVFSPDIAISPNSNTMIEKSRENHESDSSDIIYHKVKKGETLFSIAKKYNVTVNEIKNWNKLTSNVIRIDQKLKIGTI